MGQVALGFRSLFFKLAIFFVMAALLAWALGGTLWPRAETADLPSVQFEGTSWHWRVVVGGREPDAFHWTFMKRGEDGQPEPFDDTIWKRAAGPIVADGAIYYAGSASFDENAPWSLLRIISDGSGAWSRSTVSLPSRLAIEQQFDRLRRGFPLTEITGERADSAGPVAEGLNPTGHDADNGESPVIPPE